MLQQMLINTPVWVWALLAFLIVRGVMSGIGRETGIRKLFIMPLAMLALSIHGMAASFGADPFAAPAWLAATVAGTALAWALFSLDSVSVYPERGTVFQQGSWMPLMLMLAIFFVKYAVNVILHVAPQARQDGGFVIAVCVLYGLFNGIFIGRLLRILAIYRSGVARKYKLL
ncbi:DUF6622 family protein [Noviherbaspirillum aerium]|uniref:DUF6622 family protein n=1 Tax=Noviherbaspirillum aerium TaxID=2588497 RepID=UPI00124CB51E|nr:DUF6622 family protein [Noviherbaspirillum aerium]